jgi:hypothetical protein
VSFLHRRWRTRASLLAAGALEGREEEIARRHVETCSGCREEVAAVRALLESVSTEDVRGAVPEVPLAFLLTRVQARLDATPAPRAWRSWWKASVAAAGAVLLAVVLLQHHTPPGAPSVHESSVAATVDAETLRRMERNVSREQAVRFLNDAQDVLVTMAATPRDCDRETERVDVADEARRSRELLARRALLVELDDEGVASARPVLEDVEHVLRQVASFKSCARAGEVDRVRRDVERRRLLMKVRLMSRELQG